MATEACEAPAPQTGTSPIRQQKKEGGVGRAAVSRSGSSKATAGSRTASNSMHLHLIISLLPTVFHYRLCLLDLTCSVRLARCPYHTVSSHCRMVQTDYMFRAAIWAQSSLPHRTPITSLGRVCLMTNISKNKFIIITYMLHIVGIILFLYVLLRYH